MMRKLEVDYRGKRFGRLLVKGPTAVRCPSGSILWECLCDCGNIAFVRTGNLTRTKSCGCFRVDRMREVGKKTKGNYKGGKYLQRGRVLIYSPDNPSANAQGYIFEHRLLMEGKLGRHLGRKEVVHHIDGDITNNSAINLHLFKDNTSHLRWHNRLGEIALYD